MHYLYSYYARLEASIAYYEALDHEDARTLVRLLRANSARVFALMSE